MGMTGLIFSLQGRINRLSAILASTVLGMVLILFVVLFGGLGAMAGLGTSAGSETQTAAFGLVAAMIIGSGFLWGCLAITVKRLHDIGVTGWLFVIVVLTTLLTPQLTFDIGLHPINVLFTAWVWLWPGAANENAYGPPPSPGANVGTRPRTAAKPRSTVVRDADRLPPDGRGTDDDRIDRLIAEALARRRAEEEQQQEVTRLAKSKHGRSAPRQPVFGRRG